VGAPPDQFNAAGAGLGVAAVHLRGGCASGGYDAFIESIRSTMASAGGLRIDHVMGLFRLWWVPGEGGPQDGAYVRYPSDDLLDIVGARERPRTGPGGRRGSSAPSSPRAGRRSPSTRSCPTGCCLFEEDRTHPTWPVSAMAAVTTHDLPTVAGLV
jgi:4-alpha-glucanotransferase